MEMDDPQVIPANPGWRLLVYNREHASSDQLPIVAWQVVEDGVEPIALSAEYLSAEPLSRLTKSHNLLFVGILDPDTQYDDGWMEAANEVAKAEEEWDERNMSDAEKQRRVEQMLDEDETREIRIKRVRDKIAERIIEHKQTLARLPEGARRDLTYVSVLLDVEDALAVVEELS